VRALDATGEFNPCPSLADPEAVELFVVTRVLMWDVLAFGLLLVVWGIWRNTGPSPIGNSPSRRSPTAPRP